MKNSVINAYRRQLGRTVAICGLAAASSLPALAQSAPAASDQSAQLEEIIVTGTRIRTPGLVANSPISSVGELELKQTQPVAVESLIKDLPVAIPAIGPGTNNGSGGAATVDLRGLGSNRTLVLIDGRRVTPFNLFGSVDTNSIPVALIKRVDLVSGGASAVYGADAITGVVNFILRDDFEGASVNASYGLADEGDAKRRRVDVTLGGNFADGRGNAVVSAGYTKTDPLLFIDRSYVGAGPISSVSGLFQGSNTSVPSRIQVLPLPNRQLDVATGTLVAPYNTQNTNPEQYYVTPLDRKQITGIAKYEIASFAEAYVNAMFVESDVDTQLASSGTFGNTYQVPIGNPFIPQAARDQICAARGIAASQCVVGNATEVPMTIDRRFVELGPRLNSFANQTYQITTGLRGDFADLLEGWSYDAYYTYGKSEQTQTRGNWGSNSKVQQALRALNTTSCTNTANGCVPLNLFGNAGSITPAMLGFINLDAIVNQTVEMEVLSGSVSGDLGSLRSPLSEDAIGVAFGAEWRNMEAANKSDGPSQIFGEVLGTGAPTPDRRGKVELKEYYGELIAPLVSGITGVEHLNLEAGIRLTQFEAQKKSEYSTYKIGGDYSPIKDIRVRTMYQKATRAPAINELYAPLVTQLSNLATDPCQGTNINQGQANTAGTLSNLCRLTGVPVGAIGSVAPPSSSQVNILSGGNPALAPEVGRTFTAGVVLEPRFLDNLTITADYFQVRLTGAVGTPAVADIVNACYSAAANPTFAFNSACALIGRNANTGTLNGNDARGVTLALSNLGVFDVKGIDVGLDYKLDLDDVGLNDLGALTFSFRGTKNTTVEYQATPSAVNRDCLGYYSSACGTNFNGPIPEYKWSLRTNWQVSDFDVGFTWRHIGELKAEPIGPTLLPAYRKIDAYDYFDLALGWNWEETLSLNLTVSNLFDKKAPFVGQGAGSTAQNSGNTFPQTYDVVGRYFTLGATVRF
ncbi:TonB-dependent receptor [Aerophototrophica crusticola]|uniref:TonB-dependent receptor n=1 Tax=Aerophototrophica crusticola TaxID=1709002 RepID=A0A858R6Z2_9PROT|nr:TonB-dependent receptor [Rhodospirillaceae bacterium B3]